MTITRLIGNIGQLGKKAGVDITPYLGTIVTVVIAFGGTYAMVSNRLTKLETLIEDLRRDVEKHNKVVERTYVNERDIKTAFHAIDDLKAMDEKLEKRIEKLHE